MVDQLRSGSPKELRRPRLRERSKNICTQLDGRSHQEISTGMSFDWSFFKSIEGIQVPGRRSPDTPHFPTPHCSSPVVKPHLQAGLTVFKNLIGSLGLR